MSYRDAASLDGLWPGELCGVRVGGCKILLVNIDGEVHAFADRCAHLGVALSEGRLAGRTLTCRAHAWQYDACTGEGTNPRGVRLQRLPVRLENARILVDTDACARKERA